MIKNNFLQFFNPAALRMAKTPLYIYNLLRENLSFYYSIRDFNIMKFVIKFGYSLIWFNRPKTLMKLLGGLKNLVFFFSTAHLNTFQICFCIQVNPMHMNIKICREQCNETCILLKSYGKMFC